MRNLGLAWLSGKGGAQNVEQAREWLEKAATGQPADAAAMRHLALDIYHAGKGVAIDNKQALDWLQRASDAGDSTAALILGQIYRRGDWGETADENKACAYYAQSAAQNGSLPAALIQGQRDFFGSHTYRRVDDADGVYHVLWAQEGRAEEKWS